MMHSPRCYVLGLGLGVLLSFGFSATGGKSTESFAQTATFAPGEEWRLQSDQRALNGHAPVLRLCAPSRRLLGRGSPHLAQTRVQPTERRVYPMPQHCYDRYAHLLINDRSFMIQQVRAANNHKGNVKAPWRVLIVAPTHSTP